MQVVLRYVGGLSAAAAAALASRNDHLAAAAAAEQERQIQRPAPNSIGQLGALINVRPFAWLHLA